MILRTHRQAIITALLIGFALLEGVLSATWGKTPWQVLLCVVAAAALLLRRRHAGIALLLTLPSVVISTALVASLIALFALAYDARTARWVVVAGGLAVFFGSIPQWWGTDDPDDLLLSVLYSAMASAAPIALGLLARTRAELARRLDDLQTARDDERQRTEEQVLIVERARIAREMHDVVSHQVSLIAVRSGALQVGVKDEATKEAASVIRRLAVDTLGELRQMVTVLRAGNDRTVDLVPQPQLADLPALIRASEIETTTDLRLPVIASTAAQRAIYRTVQESLTNARKHAPGAPVTIVGETEGDCVVVRIANPVVDADHQDPLRASGGHGLLGLNERAELLGGRVDVHRSGQRFELELRLPLTAPQTRDTVVARRTATAR